MTMMTPGRFINALKKMPVLLDVITDGVTQERAVVLPESAAGGLTVFAP